jgi:serine/threonine-protein kinase HipA
MARSAGGKSALGRGPMKTTLQVCIGRGAVPVGEMVYVKDGAREYSSFSYASEWLRHGDRFNLSPDLALTPGHQVRKAPTPQDSCFFHAMADTEPDAWGRRVIARAHAKARKENPELKALAEIDYLCAVDDFSRIGALRLRAENGGFLRTVEEGKRTTPPLVELGRMLAASHAFERHDESAEDLRYLQGKGTSLGGLRPKCTLLDEDGTLALGKFPSIGDERCVTRGEVLALRLARLAGIDAASARIVMVSDAPVAVISRFDRTSDHARIPYLSGASMLQAPRDDERAYTELVDAINRMCLDARKDARELWRRLLFNHLITNVDDHLHNLGFLHVGKGLWRLAPAFDLNPFPDKDRESKTWLSEDTGPVTSIHTLLDQAGRFSLDKPEALQVVAEVHEVLAQWRRVATSKEVGLTPSEVDDFAPAFEHSEMQAAAQLLAWGRHR